MSIIITTPERPNPTARTEAIPTTAAVAAEEDAAAAPLLAPLLELPPSLVVGLHLSHRRASRQMGPSDVCIVRSHLDGETAVGLAMSASSASPPYCYAASPYLSIEGGHSSNGTAAAACEALAARVLAELAGGGEVLTYTVGAAASGKTQLLLGPTFEYDHPDDGSPRSKRRRGSDSAAPCLLDAVVSGLLAMEAGGLQIALSAVEVREEGRTGARAVDLFSGYQDTGDRSAVGCFMEEGADLPAAQYVRCATLRACRQVLGAALAQSHAWSPVPQEDDGRGEGRASSTVLRPTAASNEPHKGHLLLTLVAASPAAGAGEGRGNTYIWKVIDFSGPVEGGAASGPSSPYDFSSSLEPLGVLTPLREASRAPGCPLVRVLQDSLRESCSAVVCLAALRADAAADAMNKETLTLAARWGLLAGRTAAHHLSPSAAAGTEGDAAVRAAVRQRHLRREENATAARAILQTFSLADTAFLLQQRARALADEPAVGRRERKSARRKHAKEEKIPMEEPPAPATLPPCPAPAAATASPAPPPTTTATTTAVTAAARPPQKESEPEREPQPPPREHQMPSVFDKDNNTKAKSESSDTTSFPSVDRMERRHSASASSMLLQLIREESQQHRQRRDSYLSYDGERTAALSIYQTHDASATTAMNATTGAPHPEATHTETGGRACTPPTSPPPALPHTHKPETRQRAAQQPPREDEEEDAVFLSPGPLFQVPPPPATTTAVWQQLQQQVSAWEAEQRRALAELSALLASNAAEIETLARLGPRATATGSREEEEGALREALLRSQRKVLWLEEHLIAARRDPPAPSAAAVLTSPLVVDLQRQLAALQVEVQTLRQQQQQQQQVVTGEGGEGLPTPIRRVASPSPPPPTTTTMDTGAKLAQLLARATTTTADTTKTEKENEKEGGPLTGGAGGTPAAAPVAFEVVLRPGGGARWTPREEGPALPHTTRLQRAVGQVQDCALRVLSHSHVANHNDNHPNNANTHQKNNDHTPVWPYSGTVLQEERDLHQAVGALQEVSRDVEEELMEAAVREREYLSRFLLEEC